MLNLATAQSLFDLLDVFADDIITQSTHTVQADIRLNLTSAVISVLYTIVTRYDCILFYHLLHSIQLQLHLHFRFS